MRTRYIAVVGSREFTDWEIFCETLEFLIPPEKRDHVVLVSGGAPGTDTMAEEWAKKYLGPDRIKVFEADWDMLGLSAGPTRNQQIVDWCDQMIAFWDGHSKGTRDSIAKIRRAGKPLKTILWGDRIPSPFPYMPDTK